MVAHLRGIEGEAAGRKVSEPLDLFRMLDALDKPLSEHSKGMKQKVRRVRTGSGRREGFLLDAPGRTSP